LRDYTASFNDGHLGFFVPDGVENPHLDVRWPVRWCVSFGGKLPPSTRVCRMIVEYIRYHTPAQDAEA
jgi:hypothetical protein